MCSLEIKASTTFTKLSAVELRGADGQAGVGEGESEGVSVVETVDGSAVDDGGMIEG